MKTLNLRELKEYVEFLYEHGCTGEEPVLITLSQNSVGSRASTGITHITEGFDWESGQIRIEPEEKLLKKEKDRDNAMPVRVKEYDLHYKNGKKTIIRSCPICENHLKKDDRYCSRCGQRVVFE